MEKSAIHRRECIVFTTIDVINEFGIHAVSTREIAKRQGISESTVFKMFPKKVDLFSAVLDYYSQYDADLFQTTRLKKMTPKKAIIFYIDSILTSYENYPAITSITQSYDVFRYDNQLKLKIKKILESRNEFIKTRLEEAVKSVKMKNVINCENAADIILSVVRGICLKWRMFDYSFSLRQRVLENTNLILQQFGF